MNQNGPILIQSKRAAGMIIEKGRRKFPTRWNDVAFKICPNRAFDSAALLNLTL